MDLIKTKRIEDHYRLMYKNIDAVIYVINTKGVFTYINNFVEQVSRYKVKELIGKHFATIIAPESLEDALRSFKMQMNGKEIGRYELVLLDKNGEKKYFKTSESIIQNRSKVIGVVGIATDITDHKKTTEHLSKMLRELRLLYNIGTELTYIVDIDVLFQKILLHLKNTFRFERASVLLLDELTNCLVVRAATKPFPRAARKKKIKLGSGITGYVGETGNTCLANDVSKDHRYLALDKKTQSEVCVPLKIGEKTIGVINVESYRQNAFDEDDVRILSLIANQAAVAIENSRLYQSLEDSYLDTIRTLVSAMEAKDHDTRGHSERVRKYAIKIAEKLKLDETDMGVLNYAGYLHDIGKIGISDFILNKKEPLTDAEYNIIKKHPEIGHNMLKGASHLGDVCKIIRSEHEKYDGSGYPDGLKNKQIPVGARIIAVADAYDAMTTDRPYRKALPKKEAIRRLRACTGTQFDPRVVKAFLKILTGK